MVAKKRKSKRQTLKQKYKIQTRTKEHHKKLRKGSLKIKHSAGAKTKKMIDSIPNAWPYKEDLLKEIQHAKEKMEESKERAKEKRQDEIKRRREKLNSSQMDVADNGNTSTAHDSGFESATNAFAEAQTDGSFEKAASHLGQNSRRAFMRELKKVVERADVILQVLDARDPIGTKSRAVEDLVLSDHRKRLVYVLNKADLIPRDVLVGWLNHLRLSHPTIPFKCNTQSQKDHLGSSIGKVARQQEGALKSQHAVGAEELLGLLKNYCRTGDSKSIISVGIVGFPNVGKSSLLNSLTRTRAVGVSAMPGFTKSSQEVTLDKNIRLIDSPGIVFADGDSASTVLRNCVNVEELEDVLTPIQAILDRCPQPYLMQVYSIPFFKDKDCVAFLALVAKTTGKLKKGGVPNIDAAARGVIHDWNSGKIKYYCLPPAPTNASSAFEGDSMIVAGFSEEFSVEKLNPEDIRVINAIHEEKSEGKSEGVYFAVMENLVTSKMDCKIE